MTPSPAVPTETETTPPPAAAQAPAARSWLALTFVAVVAVVAVIALSVSVLLWQKLSHIQEQLARQSDDTGVQALEAKILAKQAQDTVQDSVARVALMEARLGEVALQRTQLENLMHSLSRSRDDNLVVDIESTLRIAQQQAQMTGSIEPLLGALQSALQRVQRAAQPRLNPVARALEKDLERLNSLPALDLPGMMIKLDAGMALVEGLTLSNAALAAPSPPRPLAQDSGAQTAPPWWMLALGRMGEEVKGLVRVSRIDVPEAALLSPEQAFFLRENLKLKLLNVRMGLLARQKDSVRADLGNAAVLVRRYAEPQARRTTELLQLLEQTSEQVRTAEVPRIEASLAALNTAAAGR